MTEKPMRDTLVSIVLPAYNGARTLRGCLSSVLGQTHRALQVLVVDDGSTDDTLRIAREIAAADDRVQVLHKENGGVASARNLALPACRGEYVQFVDCDDTLPPESVETLLRRAMEDGSDLVIGAFTMVLGHLREVKDLAQRDDCLETDDFLEILCKYPNSFYYGVVWNKLFRAELIEAQGVRFNPELSWGEDFDFFTHYLVRCEHVSFTSHPVYDYVKNPRGLTMQTTGGVVKHPFHAIHLKYVIYCGYRELYRQRRLYERYKSQLWKYMVGTTLTN